MAQINVQVTEAFERDLARLMKVRGIRTKSEAVRIAVAEAAAAAERQRSWFEVACDLRPFVEAGARFPTDDELWGEGPVPPMWPDERD